MTINKDNFRKFYTDLTEHTSKLWEVRHGTQPGSEWMFYCPGCKSAHRFDVGGLYPAQWTFNGDMNRPTFSPSLLCNQNYPASRCHLFLRDGMIQFLDDCWHELRGQTVPMEEI